MINVTHFPKTNSVEVTWFDTDGGSIRCQSYSQDQMDMLRADLGEYAPDYATLIADVEANTIPTPQPTAAEIHAALVEEAIELLKETDRVAGRCFKAGTNFPAEWQAYTIALRDVVNGTSTTKPIRPPYPTNT